MRHCATSYLAIVLAVGVACNDDSVGPRAPAVTSTSTAGPPLPVFSFVSAGLDHTCAVTTSGAAYCWGDNSQGQLGDGTLTSRLFPTPVVDGHAFASISAGERGTCAVAIDGRGYCWGTAYDYNFGETNAAQRCGFATCRPRHLAAEDGLTFSSFSVGQGHTCAVTTTGAGYCWGVWTDYAVIGADTTTTCVRQGFCETPTPIDGGLTFASLSAGSYSATCGVTIAGAAFCWGLNWAGALGIGTLAGPRTCFDYDTAWDVPCSYTPMAVVGGIAFGSVSTGVATTCGIAAGGAAYCWGENRFGELGSSPISNNFAVSPVPVASGLTFKTLSTSLAGFVCGVTFAGRAYCWGNNRDGELGNGTTVSLEDLRRAASNSATPVPVAGGLVFTSVSAGGTWGPLYIQRGHACGVTTDGAVYCWGRNPSGQLGNGTTANSRVPVMIAGPQ